MATVYLAIQESFEREVALKVLDPRISRDSTFSERFLTEARIVSRLMHPNIVTVYDVGTHNGLHFLSMEYVPGRDLKHRRFELSLSDNLRAVKDVARALDYAARKGCVHRDVKPDNIMLHAEDGRAVLMDFGIARIADIASSMTQTGTAVGTPHYMSPEQARGATVDGRSDLYSLGVVTFLLLTGYLPYDSDSAVSVGVMHISDTIPRLPPHLSDFQGLIDRALAKNPDDRFQSGAEFIAAIDAFSEPQLAEIEQAGERSLIDEISGETPTKYHPPEAWSAYSDVMGDNPDDALGEISELRSAQELRNAQEASEPESLFAERDEDLGDPLEAPPQRRSWGVALLLAVAVGGAAFYYQAPLLEQWGTMSERLTGFVASPEEAPGPERNDGATFRGGGEPESTPATIAADAGLAGGEPAPPATGFDPALAAPLPLKEPDSDPSGAGAMPEFPLVAEDLFEPPSAQSESPVEPATEIPAEPEGESTGERESTPEPEEAAPSVQEQTAELQEVNQLAARIERLLQQGELEAADELLRPARERFPGSPMLLALAVQHSELEDLAQNPVIERLRVSHEPPVSLDSPQEASLDGGRVLYAGFRFRNFAQTSTVIQAILHDGSRQVQIAQVPVIVQEEAGENFFRIERAVSGFAEGSYALDLMMAGERLGSVSFQIK